VPEVNPELLRWARETAGLALEDAASGLGIDEARGVPGPERLAALEAGNGSPSRPTLLRMAKLYRRPLLAFYLPEPPRTGERGHDFRTLPPDHSVRDVALVDTLIRDVRARQSMVRALLEAEDEAKPLAFVGSISRDDGVPAVLASITKTLGLDLSRYRNGVAGDRTAKRGFPYLRERAEAVGIFVLLIGNLGSHHSALDVEAFRGFALADPIAPFVVINDQDAETAWSFTLMHELAHIWLGETGVSGANPTSAIEQFCNDVAGSFLLPTTELAGEARLLGATVETVKERIGEIADRWGVSHSLVAYKLHREGMITREVWSQLSGFYRQRWRASRQAERDRSRDRDGGPSYYVIRRHRLGARLVGLAGRMLADGALSPSKAARLMGVKPGSVFGLIDASSGPAGRAA